MLPTSGCGSPEEQSMVACVQAAHCRKRVAYSGSVITVTLLGLQLVCTTPCISLHIGQHLRRCDTCFLLFPRSLSRVSRPHSLGCER